MLRGFYHESCIGQAMIGKNMVNAVEIMHPPPCAPIRFFSAIEVSVRFAKGRILPQRDAAWKLATSCFAVRCSLWRFDACPEMALSGVRSNQLSYRPTRGRNP